VQDLDWKLKRLEEKKIRRFLETRDFDFDFVRSKTYCRQFFNQLTGQNKKVLLEYLFGFAHQPFIKTKTVTPELLTKVFSQAVSIYTGLMLPQ